MRVLLPILPALYILSTPVEQVPQRQVPILDAGEVISRSDCTDEDLREQPLTDKWLQEDIVGSPICRHTDFSDGDGGVVEVITESYKRPVQDAGPNIVYFLEDPSGSMLSITEAGTITVKGSWFAIKVERGIKLIPPPGIEARAAQCGVVFSIETDAGILYGRTP